MILIILGLLLAQTVVLALAMILCTAAKRDDAHLDANPPQRRPV